MSDLTDDLLSIVRSAGIVFAGTVLGRGFGFVGHILIANALLPTRFGTVGLAFTVVSMIGTVALVGIPKAVPRRMSESARDSQGVVASAYSVAVPLGATSATFVYLFPETVATAFGSPEVAGVLRPFSLYLLCYPVAMVAIAGLRGNEQSLRATVVRDIVSPALPVGLFLVVATLGYPYLGAVAYYVLIQSLIAVLGTVVLVRGFDDPFGDLRSRLTEVPDLVSFAWPLALSANLILLMNNLDILMLGYFGGPESVGYYKTVQPLGRLAMLPLTSFTFLYLPVVTRYYEVGEIDFLGDVFTATTKWVSLLAFPLVLTFALFPESVIRLFYRPEYLPAAAALGVYTVGIFSRVFVGPNGAMVKAIDKTRVDLISAAAGVLVNVVLNVLLIPEFGIVGAALATGVGFLVYNLTEVGVVYREIGVHPFSLNTVKPLLVTAAVALVVRQGLQSDAVGIVGLAVFGAGIGALELFALVGTRSIDRQDDILLLRLLDRVGVDPDVLPAPIRPERNEK